MSKIPKRPEEKKTPGPKPVTVSLWPLSWPEALAAFMRVDPEKVRAKEKRWKARKGK